ncbi:MAG: dual specificity protein phosphatase family protein [Tatlockia sp.]|nr:dual specificity protein phosphatase family protein [Tatlockia sp.]
MRSKKDYLPFFNIPPIDTADRLYFGFSHLFNRTKVYAGYVNYNEIAIKHRNKGRLILGQLPVNAFNPDLLSKLSPNDLVVSCCEPYELAGSATLVPVTKPSLWADAGIEHHHLPFLDFTAKVNPHLAVEALKKMCETFERGGTVYVHCKAGRSRSPLIVAIFLSIMDLKTNYHKIGQEEEYYRELLEDKIKLLIEKRPQTHIDEAKILKGIKILQQFQIRNRQAKVKKISPVETKEREIYTQSPQFFAKLTQAPQFKELWHFAYNNPNYLEDMQLIMRALYKDPLTVYTILNAHHYVAFENINTNQLGQYILYKFEIFLQALIDKTLLDNPTMLVQAHKKFNQALTKYEQFEEIFLKARQLQSDLLLSPESDEDKERWLITTAKFLKAPKLKMDSYMKHIEHAVLSDKPFTRNFGKHMMELGAVMLISIFIAGAITVSTTLHPMIIIAGLGALAFVLLGYIVKQSSIDHSVRDHSRELALEIKEHNEKLEEPGQVFHQSIQLH